jgi:hypothetical protein
MKLFPGKPDKDSHSSSDGTPGLHRRTDRSEQSQQPSHRLTVDLARAERLATMLAHSRAAQFVEVADLLAGMYIYEWERLSKFWDDHDEIEGLLQKICSISPQRWNYWIEHYDQQRQKDEKERLSARRNIKEPRIGGETLPRSSELQTILARAEELTPFRDDVDGRKIPILTSECVLLCIARNQESELSSKLRDTALDLAALERSARDPRRTPQR